MRILTAEGKIKIDFWILQYHPQGVALFNDEAYLQDWYNEAQVADYLSLSYIDGCGAPDFKVTPDMFEPQIDGEGIKAQISIHSGSNGYSVSSHVDDFKEYVRPSRLYEPAMCFEDSFRHTDTHGMTRSDYISYCYEQDGGYMMQEFELADSGEFFSPIVEECYQGWIRWLNEG